MDDLEILFEDNHLIAINKSAGKLSQPDNTGDLSIREDVINYLREKYHKTGNVFLGVPHRLDRPVSGVILLAKTSKALERLTLLFRDRKVKKTYWALTNKVSDHLEGEMVHYLVRFPKKNISKAFTTNKQGAKKSILQYSILRESNGKYLFELNPLTGRHHQIRAQLSSLGCPIIGDLKYGSTMKTPDRSICLHARRLQLIHPVSKMELDIVAPLPRIQLWDPFQ